MLFSKGSPLCVCSFPNWQSGDQSKLPNEEMFLARVHCLNCRRAALWTSINDHNYFFIPHNPQTLASNLIRYLTTTLTPLCRSVDALAEDPPIPHAPPSSFLAYRLLISKTSGNPWELIQGNAKLKQKVTLPPSSTDQLRWFRELFKRLKNQTGQTFRAAQPSNPLSEQTSLAFEFTIGNTFFAIDVRTNATGVVIEAPEGFATAPIREAICKSKDGVEFEAAKEIHGSRVTAADFDPAQYFRLLVWNRDQLERFLALLIKQAKVPRQAAIA